MPHALTSFLRRTLTSVAAAAVLTALPTPAGAAPDAPDTDDRTLSPYFFVENGDPAIDQLPLASTKVNVSIAGVVADVTVAQRYTNTGKRPINARYVFPASTRAAVHGMRMTIGRQVIVAKIREREQAKKEFEAHRKAGKSAALLEEERPNVFTMSVANVMPGDAIDVTLEYTEELVPESGTYELVYPTVVGPRYSNVDARTAPKASRFVATPYLPEGQAASATFELSGTLSTAIPLDHVESPSHALVTSQDNATLTRFSLDAKDPHAGNRDFVLRYGLSGSAIQSGLSLYEGGGEKFFSLVVQPPKRVAPESVPPREYVFVLDVSGSMSGFPLDTAKELLHELAGGLRPIDRFNVVLFSGATALLSPVSLRATKENVEDALHVIDQERGGGGTELLPALQQSLSLSKEPRLSRTFIVVTDGYIEADKNAIAYVRTHLGETNVFSFGIGGSVNRFLIEGLAKAGQGEPFVVMNPTAAKTTAQKLRDYVASPVLSNVRVAMDGFDAYDVEPSAVPDVFAARPVVIRGKYRGAPRGAVTVTGATGGGSYAQRFDVATLAPRPENRALSYLWARARIASLSDYGFGEPADAEKKAVTALGLRYSLLTPYTSFIAVSEVVRNPGAPATDVTEPAPLPAGVSASAVGTPLEGAPEPGLLAMLVAIAAAAALGAARAGSARRWSAS